MAKGWRIIIIIVLITMLLGFVCIGVGVMTGANMDRIFSVLDNRYSIRGFYESFSQVIEILKSGII